jgi:tetratricopeptide (TPR) repeat protein
LPNRPGGGDNRPNRPGGPGGVGNRPGGPGGVGGIGDRPGGVGGVGGVGDRPGGPGGVGGVGGVGNRPGGGVGSNLPALGAGIAGGAIGNRIGNNRPDRGNINTGNINTGNQGIINSNRPTINNNRPVTINQANWNNFQNVNRGYGGYGGWAANGNWRGNYGYLHDNWYNGSWPYWNGRGAGWFAAGTAFGWLASPGESIAYSNPYYEAPPESTVVNQYIDYSEPIATPVITVVESAPAELPVIINGTDTDTQPADQSGEASPAPQPPDDQKVKEQLAKDLLADATDQFKKGDYAAAQKTVEKALEQLPSDAALHEFRALTLFAQKKYKEAAAAVYAVLAVGPGWNWDTLKSLYPDADTYTKQLRALEDYQKQNPKSADASFLLAYHYLTLGSVDAAIKQLQHCVELQPKDQVSAQLIKMLKQPQGESKDKDKPQPGT